MKRRCCSCKVERDIEEFCRNRLIPDGRARRCKHCDKTHRSKTREKRSANNKAWKAAHPERVEESRREWQYRTKYGITLEDYDRMLAQQQGRCAVCRKEDTGTRNKFFCVDHEHVDGFKELPPEQKRRYVRGLLCVTCNLVVGKLEEFPGAYAAFICRTSTWGTGASPQVELAP